MKVKIVDLTLRDAHQSLMATRLRTRDMLPILETFDEAGIYCFEVWGGATFDSCIRYLNENPWERLKEIRKRIKNSLISMLLRGQNLVGYRHYPDDVVEKFVRKTAEYGMDVFRIFDALNDVRNLVTSIKVAKECDAHVQGTICYTISPVHTIEKYVEIANELAVLEVDSICIKDMAGLLSPKMAYTLVRTLKKEVGLPIDVHSHYTSGMASMALLKAVEAGAKMIDTVISPLSLGTSHPPTESMVYALEELGYETGVKLDVLLEVREYFMKIREKYQGYIDWRSTIPDTNVLVYQIPGGMFSNLIAQLKEYNALDKLPEVLKEVPKVREDLGYVPLVTPTSQIVGVQAVLNVITGERYKVVTKETKDLVKGMYGKTPTPIKEEIRKKILGDEKPIECRPADLLEPEFEKRRQELIEMGFENPSDEDVLIYTLFPQVGLKFLKGEAKEEPIPVGGKIEGTFEVEIEGEKMKISVKPL
ncbi:pyruvate carboxylase subunit B [Archaeoglobus profundus]|uniref:Oxaloacetate decarboxylase alpha subunit n=1 Tax=Archaeoglobus profundus (strain DSM 5631 / JCM 9629 / NBRC 100127 / Av18) TaxID=572546 RepID=D2RFK8_ARCPA|nr:pyruvate carboxylase subunit B [Archaeoglobus profundus]ADB57083.1 oxaloacetate decarboxylase alpha subunit [Archaeoglobus profundus DSM 5631]